jgi:uncharacterized RmlC-like cupin family protein
MSSSAIAKAHYHKGIETIDYLLEGECPVYYDDNLQKRVSTRGRSVSLPPTCRTLRGNESGKPCTSDRNALFWQRPEWYRTIAGP